MSAKQTGGWGGNEKNRELPEPADQARISQESMTLLKRPKGMPEGRRMGMNNGEKMQAF